MVICLQWEEQENWLQENHKNTQELLYMAGLFANTIYYYYIMLFKLLPYGLPYRH